MIYTVTISPSLDRMVEVEELIYDEVNPIVDAKEHSAGKGVDVSRVIKELGGRSIAIGFVGGYNGLQFEGKLLNEGLVCDFLRIGEETKTNIILLQQKRKMQTLLATSGPRLGETELAMFFEKLRAIPAGSYVVLNGNLPATMDDQFFAQAITVLKQKGAKVILDSDGEPMRNGVAASPFLVKPNIHELGRLLGKSIVDLGEVVEGGRSLLDSSRYVVVSLGARGAVGISEEGVYHAVPPKVEVRSSAGAGVSLVAGMVWALSRGDELDEDLALGVACGTATTLNAGNDLCRKEDVGIIRKSLIVKKI
jgi:6-phosphofructokinase 2